MTAEVLAEGLTYELCTDDALHGMTLRIDEIHADDGDVTVTYDDGTTTTYDADRLDEQARNGTLVAVTA